MVSCHVKYKQQVIFQCLKALKSLCRESSRWFVLKKSIHHISIFYITKNDDLFSAAFSSQTQWLPVLHFMYYALVEESNANNKNLVCMANLLHSQYKIAN